MANKTIMIIEDDQLHMKLFSDILETQGYETLRTADGNTAVSLARDHHPDLILLDIRLPFVSGLEVVQRLKGESELKDIPVVAVTAMADDTDKEEYLKKGFDGFLSKPIAIPNLLRTVASFLDPMPYIVH